MPAGRPRKILDEEQIMYLASMGCTQGEIAGFFGVAPSTISENYRSVYALGASESKITLRKRQWNASKRSVPMLIHLGKNHLGQSDKVDARVDTRSDTRTTFGIDEGLTERLRLAIEAYGYRRTGGGLGVNISGPLRDSGESGQVEDSSTPGASES